MYIFFKPECLRLSSSKTVQIVYQRQCNLCMNDVQRDAIFCNISYSPVVLSINCGNDINFAETHK